MRLRKTYKCAVRDGKILNSKSESQNDTYSCSYVNNLQPEVAWENPNRGAAFETNTLFQVNGGKYRFMQIIAKASVADDQEISVTLEPGHTAQLIWVNGGNGQLWIREIFWENITYMKAGMAVRPGVTGDNNYLIPVKVIGYK